VARVHIYTQTIHRTTQLTQNNTENNTIQSYYNTQHYIYLATVHHMKGSNGKEN